MSNKKKIDAVWNKGKPIRGKNPNTHRRDAAGNVIYKASYGKNSPMGWQVDHIYAKSKGGADRLGNMQPLQTKANKRKSNKMPNKASRSNYRPKKK